MSKVYRNGTKFKHPWNVMERGSAYNSPETPSRGVSRSAHGFSKRNGGTPKFECRHWQDKDGVEWVTVTRLK